MQRWAHYLSGVGDVVHFDYPYMQAGRRRPDRLPVLIEAHRAALVEARTEREGPVLLVGKSMGSRVGCHLSLEEMVNGLVCLGYPLLGQSGQVRSEVLLALRAPILFVQGSRDPLCPLELLEGVRARMAAPSSMHVVEGGNHSLELGRRELAARASTQVDVDRAVLARIASFVDRLAETSAQVAGIASLHKA
jgi:uncharacterized protein